MLWIYQILDVIARCIGGIFNSFAQTTGHALACRNTAVAFMSIGWTAAQQTEVRAGQATSLTSNYQCRDNMEEPKGTTGRQGAGFGEPANCPGDNLLT